MTTATSNNLLLGSGKLYFDVLENGVRTGEYDVGNVSSLGLTTTDEIKEKNQSMTAERGLYATALTKRTVELDITGDEFSQENMALNTMGVLAKLVQVAGTATDETVTATTRKGRIYPLAKRMVSDVVISVGAVVMVEGVDYAIIDASRIKVLVGGAIVDGSVLTADYSFATLSLDTVQGAKLKQVEVFARFVGDPTAGPAYEVEIWRVQLSPTGALGFISDDFGSWTLKGKVLMDTTKPAGMSQYYQAIKLN